MKELKSMLRECNNEMELIAMMIVICVGVIGWICLCIYAPEWIVRTLAFPFVFFAFGACTKFTKWLNAQTAEDND